MYQDNHMHVHVQYTSTSMRTMYHYVQHVRSVILLSFSLPYLFSPPTHPLSLSLSFSLLSHLRISPSLFHQPLSMRHSRTSLQEDEIRAAITKMAVRGHASGSLSSVADVGTGDYTSEFSRDCLPLTIINSY